MKKTVECLKYEFSSQVTYDSRLWKKLTWWKKWTMTVCLLFTNYCVQIATLKHELYYYESGATLNKPPVTLSQLVGLTAYIFTKKINFVKFCVNIPNVQKYSFHNCMALRKIQILMKVCDCVPFYFPANDDYRICNFRDVECVQNVISPFENIEGSTEEDPRTENLIKCLPECEHFDYPLEVALGKLSVNVPLRDTSFYQGIKLENRSVLNVFFNDLVSTRYRRDVYLNWQNILAAFGGLLSLMLGFTLISGFDFVLFFTLRVVYDLISRFFIDEPDSNKNLKINVEEYNKEKWVKSTKRGKMYAQNITKKIEVNNDKHWY